MVNISKQWKYYRKLICYTYEFKNSVTKHNKQLGKRMNKVLNIMLFIHILFSMQKYNKN